jgi:hypothetical protein
MNGRGMREAAAAEDAAEAAENDRQARAARRPRQEVAPSPASA